jgi:23S rRNA (cytidine1920-2'-O)/16S rRNA (cytidine1409-2'-O)-methyltransferase
VPARARLDAELVRRGLARSREQAAELIAAGRVAVAGQTASKSATQVAKDTPVTVAGDDDDAKYVSRGGHKLAGALAAFDGLSVAGKRCLDAGASTGGFTDVLLRAGAAQVVAVDVGYGQLAWSLRTDERVTVLDRVNVRALEPAQVAPPPQVVVADLSFISLTVVLPALVGCAAPDADFALMVKPQFEVGRGRVGAGGVVRSPDDRADAVRTVCAAAATLGLGVRGVTASPLPGPSGNVEYFVWFTAGAPPLDEAALRAAIESGPR